MNDLSDLSHLLRQIQLGVGVAVVAIALTACSKLTSTPPPTIGSTPHSTGAAFTTPSPETTRSPETTPSAATTSPEPAESGGTTTGGDIPDNAVFLTYADSAHGFSIDYVEGWQVTPSTDGVVIRDKDSSETVQIVPAVTDIAAYIASTDLPSLQGLSGFALQTQDTVTIGGRVFDHLVYSAPSPPDPVTNKEVASTIDRYYVPGSAGLAIVTLSTPNGVDNVDAFRQMIESLMWS